jgi:[acyl-carrier-protein] S-malonyltransferase
LRDEPARSPAGGSRRYPPPVSFAVVFPGQGSQFLGMAGAWILHPAGKSVLDDVSEAIGRDVVEGCNDEAALSTTEFVQPALLACDIAAFRVIEAEGASDWVGAAGHSLGEFAALVAAEVLTMSEAIKVVIVRGRAMQLAGEERPGTMTALLGIGGDEAEALCGDARGDDVLVVANRNSPAQAVASGSVNAIERLEALAKERRIRAVRLPVAGAFHSSLMEPAVAEIDAAIDALTFRRPRFPIAENVTGEIVDDSADLQALLRRHVVSPVRWEDCARSLIAAGATMLVEAGVGDVLTKLQRRIDPDVGAVAVGSPEAAEAVATTRPA